MYTRMVGTSETAYLSSQTLVGSTLMPARSK